MSSVCVNCGAELYPGSKFCRQCGKSAGTTGPATPSEAPTRALDAPDPSAKATQGFQPGLTGPAYLSPETASGLMETRKKGNRTRNILIVSSLVVIILAFLGVGTAYWFARVILNAHGGAGGAGGAARNAPQIIIGPQAPSPAIAIPTIPPVPTPPVPNQPSKKAPAAKDSGAQTAPAADALIYPGAETNLNLASGKGRVLQLHTKDSSEKVIDWYVSKLKPSKVVRAPGGHAVLVSGNTHVVINGSDGGANVLLNQSANGNDSSFDFDTDDSNDNR